MDLIAARNLQALSPGFHIILVCVGVAFPVFVLTMGGLYLRTRDDLYRRIARRWTKAMAIVSAVAPAGPAAILALESGWITTEVGHQPWIVYNSMRTTDAVTSATGIPIAQIALGGVYPGLMFGVIWRFAVWRTRPRSLSGPRSPRSGRVNLALGCLPFAGFIVSGAIALLRPTRLGDKGPRSS